MAIVRGSSEHYWWKVKHKVPMDNGKFLAVGFTAKFKRFSKDRVATLMGDGGEDAQINVSEVIGEVLIGWKEMKDIEIEDGSSPDFANDEQREWVLGIIGMDLAVFKAWTHSITQGAVKN